jgi:hypothetical protein
MTNLRSRNRVAGIGQQRRPPEQGTDGSDIRAFESDLREAVLRNLHGGTDLLHLATKLLHVGNREACIVGHDDNARALEHLVERRDEISFCRSVHLALSG